MKQFTKTSFQGEPRLELHEVLGLTGAEVTVNSLPAGACVPFVHAHKENEEIYFVVHGSGKAVIDGEEVSLQSGDFLKVAPIAKRQFFSSSDEGIMYLCIQVKANSLNGYTVSDAIIY